MNDKLLKKGLLQLAGQGWHIVEITDEYLDNLLGLEIDPPSEELKEHFLSTLRVRIQDAAMQQSVCNPLNLNSANQVRSSHVYNYEHKQKGKGI
jgi:hypothetical protein